MATDMDSGIRIDVADGFKEDGAYLLSRDKVGLILKESSAEDVTIDADDKSIRIDVGAKYTLASVNPDEFPTVQPFSAQSFASSPKCYQTPPLLAHG